MVKIFTRFGRCLLWLVTPVLVAACGRFPSGVSTGPGFWLTPEVARTSGIAGATTTPGPIILDTLSFRALQTTVSVQSTIQGTPASDSDKNQEATTGSRQNREVSARSGTDRDTNRNLLRAAVVTSFQGQRHHPETVRALAADSQALASTAGAVAAHARKAGANAMIIDLQGMTAADIRQLIDVTRAIADSARAYVLGPIGFVVPAADTAAYPGALIARTADFIVLRLMGEHRPGTAPGSFATPVWFGRQLGIRAAEVGASRVIAELPLSGYRWERDGTARRVTYSEAQALVVVEGLAFRRDPETRALTASSPRDGWEIWINDHETTQFLIAAARRTGVNRFVFAGIEGSDPQIWTTFGHSLRR